MRKELADFRFRHFSRMLFVVKENETTNPAHIGFFGAQAVVPEARHNSDLIEQFGSRHGWTNSLYCELLKGNKLKVSGAV